MKSSILVLSLLLALPLSAEYCDLQLRYENGQVRWKSVSGANRYTILKTFGDLKAPEYSSTRNTFIEVDERASSAVTVRYIVTAEIESGVRMMATWNDACTGSIDVTLPVNEAFRKFTRRAILPVVGSTPGAFGGQFRTSLELRGQAAERGRIVFHPAGKIAADSDPSMPYSFLESRVMAWDDVLAAMGQSGLGSLEIIPDDDSIGRVPQMQVRLYNDTSLGTFGTFATPVVPYDYLRPPSFQLRIPDDRFRVNMGIRTLEATRVSILFQRPNGQLDGQRELTFPAGWMEMKGVAEFVGKTLEPGHLLIISVEGAAVPFYTITENRTNDPTLVVPPKVGTSRDVGTFVD